MPDHDLSQSASAATSSHYPASKTALERLGTHVKGLHEKQTTLSAQADQIAKSLSGIGYKLGNAFNPFGLPIDASFLDEVFDALKDGGRNVKSLQRKLGIYDPTELSRKRKALVAAGVTRETENYMGTRTTFIELIPVAAAPPAPPAELAAPIDEAIDEADEEEMEEIPPGSIVPPRKKTAAAKPETAK